jgi:Succinylglutamate desuccinylase / Aspartoacylase family
MKKSILVIGGIHGDENLGIDLVNLIRNHPLENVHAIFGNPMAAAVKTRYIDKDLNRVFPGNQNGCLEELRAFQIMQIAKNYDLVIDVNNTTSPNNDCSFVGSGYSAVSLMLAHNLGLENVVIAPYDCINKYLPTCLSIEISLQSELNNAQYWYDQIVKATFIHEDDDYFKTLKLYQYMTTINEQKYKSLGLNFQNFTVLTNSDKQKLRMDTNIKAAAIFVNPNLYLGDYCAIVQEVNIPL